MAATLSQQDLLRKVTKEEYVKKQEQLLLIKKVTLDSQRRKI